MKLLIELTPEELFAAWIACSNYTGKRPGWKQAAQSRAASKLFGVVQKHNKKTGKS